MVARYAAASASVLSLPLMVLCLTSDAGAADFTAGSIMEKMNADERFLYINGVVDGTAYARFLRDGKQEAGMKCINDWFYHDKTAMPKIYAAFARYPSYPPNVVISVVANNQCGDK